MVYSLRFGRRFFCPGENEGAIKDRPKPVFFCLVSSCSVLGGSSNGAGRSTGAAFHAGIRVDLVLSVAFRDRGNGAFGSARAAADAVIGNFVSHFLPPKYYVLGER